MKLDELKHLPIEGITIDKDNNYFLIADVALISTDSDILKPYLILGTHRIHDSKYGLVYSLEAVERKYNQEFIPSAYGAYNPKKQFVAINPKLMDIDKIREYISIQK
ncbi:MAG: hypothetical protein QXL18_02605 [Candidatus Woesearchaeota archaeon]